MANVIPMFVMAICCLAQFAQGEDYEWVNAGSGTWASQANWLDSSFEPGVPGGNDNANINNGGTATVGSGLEKACNVLCLGLFDGQSGNMEVSGTLSLGGLTIGSLGVGTFTQTGGVVTTSGGISLADYAEGSDQGEGTYTISGGTFTTTNGVMVGECGAGEFVQSGGTVNVSGGWFNLATRLQRAGDDPPYGIYSLSGGTLNNAGDDIYIGDEGTGVFEQTGGIHNATGPHGISLGFRDDNTNGVRRIGKGTYNLSGGELYVNCEVVISKYANPTGSGEGKMTIKGNMGPKENGSARVKFGALFLGACQGQGGTLTIGDANDHVLGRPDAHVEITGRITYQYKSASIWFGRWGVFETVSPTSTPSTVTYHLTAANSHVAIASEALGSNLTGLGHTTLSFETQDASGLVKTIEAAGVDPGFENVSSQDFCAANFLLDTLSVGASGAGGVVTLKLLDDWDNQEDEAEAVYVNTVVFEANGFMDLNGMNVYYLNGGDPKRLVPGDFNVDGVVDFTDYQILESNFGTGSGMGWKDGDCDGDGDVDFTDYQILESNWGRGFRARGEELPALPVLKDYDEDNDVDIDDLHILQQM